MFALLVDKPVPGDVNELGRRSGVLIGVGATLVVSGVLESCGITWNQPSTATLSPACWAYALADRTANSIARQTFFIFFLLRRSCRASHAMDGGGSSTRPVRWIFVGRRPLRCVAVSRSSRGAAASLRRGGACGARYWTKAPIVKYGEVAVVRSR